MYQKQHLIADIESYTPHDEKEHQDKGRMLALLHSTDDCFERHHFPCHFTGSAWVVSPDGRQILMTHHKALDKWLQFGGHADGDIHIRSVALREALEESGIDAFEFITPGIFDLDIHAIPENSRRNEPAHFHYDLRYLLRARTTDILLSDESNALQWFTPPELIAMNLSPEINRMLEKSLKLQALTRV